MIGAKFFVGPGRKAFRIHQGEHCRDSLGARSDPRCRVFRERWKSYFFSVPGAIGKVVRRRKGKLAMGTRFAAVWSKLPSARVGPSQLCFLHVLPPGHLKEDEVMQLVCGGCSMKNCTRYAVKAGTLLSSRSAQSLSSCYLLAIPIGSQQLDYFC